MRSLSSNYKSNWKFNFASIKFVCQDELHLTELVITSLYQFKTSFNISVSGAGFLFVKTDLGTVRPGYRPVRCAIFVTTFDLVTCVGLP